MKRRLIVAVLSLATCMIVLLAGAAPILPTPHVPDNVRSLAKLDRLRLEIAHVAAELKDAGLDPQELEHEWRRELREAGIDIVEDEDAPRLWFVANVLNDDSVPEAIAISAILGFDQTIHVPRLGRPLTLPTYTQQYLGMSSKEKLQEEHVRLLKTTMDRFIARVSLATKHLED